MPFNLGIINGSCTFECAVSQQIIRSTIVLRCYGASIKLPIYIFHLGADDVCRKV